MELRNPQDYIGEEILRFAQENEVVIKERCLERMATFYQNTPVSEMIPKFRAGEVEHGGMTTAKLELMNLKDFGDDELRDLLWYVTMQYYHDFQRCLEEKPRPTFGHEA